MTIERVAVCDICRNKNRKTRRYSVSTPAHDGLPAKVRAVDLCSEHEEPLVKLLKLPPRKRGELDRIRTPRKRATPSRVS